MQFWEHLLKLYPGAPEGLRPLQKSRITTYQMISHRFTIYFHRVRKKFFPLIESGLFNFDDPEQRELLRSALMTTCDIASICKPWEVQRKVADLVVSEFFEQGDKVRHRIHGKFCFVILCCSTGATFS